MRRRHGSLRHMKRPYVSHMRPLRRPFLARVHWNVDYIISHCCPSSIQDVLSGGMFKKDALTEFFDEVRQKCTFRYWFFGHYHSNMVIEKRYAMLYEQIIRLK